jgi:predicted MFS family arabinose efflux permease
MLAAAKSIFWLCLASFVVGATSANVHVVIPFAAHLAAPEQRGRVVGSVLSGLLFGILLARTFSGAVGAWLGWRSVYIIAACAMIVLAAAVRMLLPTSRPEVRLQWFELMRSTGRLVIKYSTLREAALLGALFFAGFSAFWTTLIFLLQSPAYQYGSTAAGLFGLVGAAGAAGAPAIGHLADKHGPRFTLSIGLWLTLISFVIMGLAGTWLVFLILGVVLMDLGVQIGHVSNQTRIYSLDPKARSRLNMVYMVCYFAGGAAGSYLGAVGWRWFGWTGVCGFGAVAIICALTLHYTYNRKHPARPVTAFRPTDVTPMDEP